MRKEPKIEGYWYSEYEPQYPMPKANVLSDSEAQEIYDLIIEKQKTARVNSYKGSSTSRITQERLGSREFQTSEWRWPKDFAKHYVLDHKVKPTNEFLEYIGWLTN